MTPRGGSGSSGSAPTPTPSSGSSGGGGGVLGGGGAMTPRADAASSTPGSRARAESRKHKKSFYAKLKRDEDDKMAELAAKYRDRAKERRDGGVGTADAPPGMEESSDDAETNVKRQIAARVAAAAAAADNSGGAGYRAVAPDLKSSYDAAERRKRMIQESKFLGGNMEHTHLVKGLDFALLQKVRSEIYNLEKEDNAEEESGGGGDNRKAW